MVDTNKHLVYAEDIIYAIMQYPFHNLEKSTVKQIIEQVTEEKKVTIGSLMPIG